MSDTLIKWNAEAGTRFLTIRQDGSFSINEDTPPLYALGELAKAFMRQKDRIKRLEEAGDRLAYWSDGNIKPQVDAIEAWRKAKEAKP